MNIAIDTTPLASGHAARGVGVYTKNLIKALQKYEGEHSYSFFTRSQQLPKDADIVHYPYFDPFFLTLPLQKRAPTVVTVHDLIPLVFPDKFPAGLRGMVKWQMQKAALRKADRIITVSECSKNDVKRLVGIDERKIDVVYSAATDGYKNVTNTTILHKLKKKYTLPDNYFLYVGDVNWNKNIPGMIRAFAEFLKKSNTYHLVLVGRAFLDGTLKETRVIRSVIQELQIADHIICTGYASDEDVAGLYSMANCSLEPSHYEGFGLPVLESMASGCPVLVADNSSLNEIAGPSVRIHADSIESIAEGMNTIASLSSEARKKLVDDGIAWSHGFSWEKTAKETVAVYEKVLG
jgi:glycosyltransferase involved in cell wall biosynthesis